ncbi:hypothetical protein BX616_004580 [Lobosporangium transversale]|uniref:NAD(P)-binding domain-containing protein n=1 Tax=Lobosporangium transversale TaxID=64571 RepID=A0A1Y2GWU1_9FUNG|nr:hypothetical protein BCR41DRAFT_347870 [Lobosporangium transversale]KAF9916115.1 hypothetical protein BX616_004580 [Lobosporangium transversale]ORZ26756.1 hypothetical protein BCR41DRAFT_347870 [Lobosporangium transversale]|eukprot:XP_021884519.1 hypothetical protein BCR41DRAFT_347870 [Lobosporangium transversale]
MAPIRIFFLGATGYIGSSIIDLLHQKKTIGTKYALHALVRSQEKADRLRSLGIEPVLGSLDDSNLLEQEASKADVVLAAADADHLPSAKAVIKGLLHRPRAHADSRKRPILIHTSGTGVLLDGAYGKFGSDTIYYDNDVAQLSTLKPTQPHRNVDLEVISPQLVGKVDTYIVAPPTIWGFGAGPGNHNSIQVPLHVSASLKSQQALQIGQGLNYWSKVHVADLAHFYVSLLERALQEPQDEEEERQAASDQDRTPLPKNEDAYYFVQEGEDFTWGEVAREIAKALKELGVNDSGEVQATNPEEEQTYWPENSGSLLGGNSRSRAAKGKEILGWEPKHREFKEYIADEVRRQYNLQKQ